MAADEHLHLIIVPGHGVCKAGFNTPELSLLDSSWVGIFPGEGPLYVEHAREGVRRAAADASAPYPRRRPLA